MVEDGALLGLRRDEGFALVYQHDAVQYDGQDAERLAHAEQGAGDVVEEAQLGGFHQTLDAAAEEVGQHHGADKGDEEGDEDGAFAFEANQFGHPLREVDRGPDAGYDAGQGGRFADEAALPPFENEPCQGDGQQDVEYCHGSNYI